MFFEICTASWFCKTAGIAIYIWIDARSVPQNTAAVQVDLRLEFFRASNQWSLSTMSTIMEIGLIFARSLNYFADFKKIF